MHFPTNCTPAQNNIYYTLITPTNMNRLLWVDDEIELLRPYIIFLENKDYEVVMATNGQDAIDLCREQAFDLIFLDENMPGLSGLETLSRIKEINSAIPIVMGVGGYDIKSLVKQSWLVSLVFCLVYVLYVMTVLPCF